MIIRNSKRVIHLIDTVKRRKLLTSLLKIKLRYQNFGELLSSESAKKVRMGMAKKKRKGRSVSRPNSELRNECMELAR